MLDDATRYHFDPSHEGTVETGYVLENLWVELSPGQVKHLYAADTIEGLVGVNKFRLNRAQIAALRDFIDHVNDPDLAPSAKRPPTPEEAAAAKAAAGKAAAEDARIKAEAKAEMDRDQRKQAAAQRKQAAARAESKLKAAQNLEKQGKQAAAARFYREIVRDLPGTPAARLAADRLKALTAK